MHQPNREDNPSIIKMILPMFHCMYSITQTSYIHIHTYSLISGGGDVAGLIVIHDTMRPTGETGGTYTCPVTVSTYGSYVDNQ